MHPRTPTIVLSVLTTAALLLGGSTRAYAEDAAPPKPAEAAAAKAALKAFDTAFKSEARSARIRAIEALAPIQHKNVVKRLGKVLKKEKDILVLTATAEALGQQAAEAKRARATLCETLDANKKLAWHQTKMDDPVLKPRIDAQAKFLVACIQSLQALFPHSPKRTKKDGWADIAPLIDHIHNDVAQAMFDYCAATKEYRGIHLIEAWFAYYPTELSWAGTGDGGVSTESGAGTARFAGAMGFRPNTSRDAAWTAMKEAVKVLTGKDMPDAKALRRWISENKRLLKKQGV